MVKGEHRVAKEALAYKINEDKEYAERIFQDYEYAKIEFQNAGIEIDPNTHEQLKNSFKNLEEANQKLFGSKGTRTSISVSRFE